MSSNSSSQSRQFHNVCESDEFYYVSGIIGRQVKKTSGAGRVWEYFNRNHDTEVTLEKIAGLSNWKNPRHLMNSGFFRSVNEKSEYQFIKKEVDGKVTYKLSKKTSVKL